MSIEWTDELRAAWDKSWSEHHMQVGLMLIKERLWPTTIAIPAGHDPQVIAACAHHALIGNNQVFAEIQKLRQAAHRPKPLPAPNTPEALGIAVKKPE